MERTLAPTETENTRGVTFGKKLTAYLAIEAVWLPSLYFACYRYRPAVRFVETPLGKKVVQRASAWLQRAAPSWHERVAALSARVYGAPHGRTFAEWVLVNKLLTPVAFPAKLWLAHRIVERRNAAAAALARGEWPPSPVRADARRRPT
jgi:hypothetical protein